MDSEDDFWYRHSPRSVSQLGQE
uniref:Uncharacterized protein n=1 Tax=Rhizophora mucronata TaxID=61149 RepID=A0A2P2QC34_RHIMU